jgi:enediyne biosynthesis protein E7
VLRAFAPLVRTGRPRPDEPPGPTGRRLRVAMDRDTPRTLTWIREHYGDVARLQLGPTALHITAYLVSDPDLVRDVLATNANRYTKAPTYGILRTFIGDGLLTLEDDAWRRHRRLVAPVFEPRHVEALDRAITDAAAGSVERLRAADGAVVDLAAEMSRVTLTAVGAALFGADLGGAAVRIADALTTLQAVTDRAFAAPLTWPLTLVDGRHMTAAAREAGRELDAVVADLLAQPTGDDDVTLLSLLREARDEEGRPLTADELRDELVTFILPGHETTALALAWTFAELGRHPEVRRRLTAEIDGVLGERTPTSEDAAKLTYTTAVLEETMRLHPPAWVVERAPIDDEVLGGFHIPAGGDVLISPYVVHRHPDHWEEPEAFDPERFLGTRRDERHRHAYIPFGAGRRRCVGDGFAMLEATLLLAELARAFRFDLLPGRPVEHDPAITLRIRDGLPVRVHDR